eukprot:361612-Chlamydomonas_euryale.AAC.10
MGEVRGCRCRVGDVKLKDGWRMRERDRDRTLAASRSPTASPTPPLRHSHPLPHPYPPNQPPPRPYRPPHRPPHLPASQPAATATATLDFLDAVTSPLTSITITPPAHAPSGTASPPVPWEREPCTPAGCRQQTQTACRSHCGAQEDHPGCESSGGGGDGRSAGRNQLADHTAWPGKKLSGCGGWGMKVGSAVRDANNLPTALQGQRQLVARLWGVEVWRSQGCNAKKTQNCVSEGGQHSKW